jgi:RNA polymerase sigma-70 factor, ECF subfamily
LANSQEAEDLTQEIFLTLWRKSSTNPDCRFFVCYLVTITRSRAIDKISDRTRQEIFEIEWGFVIALDIREGLLFEFFGIFSIDVRC